MNWVVILVGATHNVNNSLCHIKGENKNINRKLTLGDFNFKES